MITSQVWLSNGKKVGSSSQEVVNMAAVHHVTKPSGNTSTLKSLLNISPIISSSLKSQPRYNETHFKANCLTMLLFKVEREMRMSK